MEYRPIRGVDQDPGHRLVPSFSSTRTVRYRRPAMEYVLAAAIMTGLLAIALFINSYLRLREDNAGLQRTVTYLQHQKDSCHAAVD